MDVHHVARAITSAARSYIGEPAANSLVRRAVQNGFPGEPANAPNGRFAVVVVTALLGTVGVILLQYTFKLLLILAIVESPAPISLPLDSTDRKAASVLGIGADTQSIYATASIRGGMKHLRQAAGRWALWRGFNANVAYVFGVMLLRGILYDIFKVVVINGTVARLISGVASWVVLARLGMVCTHIMISAPQEKTWIRRTLSTPWATARKTIPAMAIFAFVHTVTTELFLWSSTAHGSVRSALAVLAFLVSIFVGFPTTVALIRVQASLLPETEEAIVEFDREFGKQSGSMLTVKEALKSVGCKGWKRVYGLAIKTGLIVGAIVAALVVLVMVEMIWVMAGVANNGQGTVSWKFYVKWE